MKIIIFSTQYYERDYFNAINHHHEITFIDDNLNEHTVEKITDQKMISCFVLDQLNSTVLNQLKSKGVKLIALRSAGFDHVDLAAAKSCGITVARVPAYSPNAVAEFTIALLLALVRKIPRAHDLVRQHNFSLAGQLGFNLQGKTVGVIGTGMIGSIVAKILIGFDCTVLAYDLVQNEDCKKRGVRYVDEKTLLQQSDIITLHCPLNQSTKHIINAEKINLMKPGVVIINTGRGGLLDTRAAVDALKNKKISGLGLDVYEFEKGLFFQDHSSDTISDALFLELQSFPNVLITGHQAYFTQEAVTNIIKTTLDNMDAFEKGRLVNVV